METTTGNHLVVRPARRVRLIEHSGVVMAFPEPHRPPVLPPGWAPLSRDQQEAVQRACDAAPECLIFKLGSLWEPGCEYRVYRLATEQWAGLSVVCKFAAADGRKPGESTGQPPGAPCNGQLLGLAWEPLAALRIATDFFNWDLEAHGQSWRLSVHDAHVEQS
jgi:hypothetical protein